MPISQFTITAQRIGQPMHDSSCALFTARSDVLYAIQHEVLYDQASHPQLPSVKSRRLSMIRFIVFRR